MDFVLCVIQFELMITRNWTESDTGHLPITPFSGDLAVFSPRFHSPNTLNLLSSIMEDVRVRIPKAARRLRDISRGEILTRTRKYPS